MIHTRPAAVPRERKLPLTNLMSDEARHELRWQTVLWVLKCCCQTGGPFARPSLDSGGPEGYLRYTSGEPWAMRPATVTMDLFAIGKRLQLYRDNLHGHMANSDRTYEDVLKRRIETWDERAFEILVETARKAGWCGADDPSFKAFVASRGLLNRENRIVRMQARVDELERLELAEIADQVEDARSGAW